MHHVGHCLRATGVVLQPFDTNAPQPVVDSDFISCAVCAWLYRFQIVGHLLSLGFCLTCENASFCRCVYEVLAFTGCYVTYAGRCVPTFRDSLPVSHLQFSSCPTVWWDRYAVPKRRYTATSICCVKTHKSEVLCLNFLSWNILNLTTNFLGLKIGGHILNGDTYSGATHTCYYLFRTVMSVSGVPSCFQ